MRCRCSLHLLALFAYTKSEGHTSRVPWTTTRRDMSAIRFQGAFSRSDKQIEELKFHTLLFVIAPMIAGFEILGKMAIDFSVL